MAKQTNKQTFAPIEMTTTKSKSVCLLKFMKLLFQKSTEHLPYEWVAIICHLSGSEHNLPFSHLVGLKISKPWKSTGLMRACWGLLKPRAANGHITYPWLSFCILKELHVCNLTNYMRHTKEKIPKEQKEFEVSQSSSLRWPWQCRLQVELFHQWSTVSPDQHSTRQQHASLGSDWAPKSQGQRETQLHPTWEIQKTSTWSVCQQFPCAVFHFKDVSCPFGSQRPRCCF